MGPSCVENSGYRTVGSQPPIRNEWCHALLGIPVGSRLLFWFISYRCCLALTKEIIVFVPDACWNGSKMPTGSYEWYHVRLAALLD